MQQLVAHRQERDTNPDDRFRGLYLSNDDVAALAEPVEWPAPSEQVRELIESADALEAPSRLRQIATNFALDETDIELLVAVLAPDLDQRFESYYGYLQDDVTMRRAGVGLALALVGCPVADAYDRLGSSSALVSSGLVEVQPAPLPLLRRQLSVPDPVLSYLLGRDVLIDEVADVSDVVAASSQPAADRIAEALDAGLWLVYMREPAGAMAPAVAVAACAGVGLSALCVDLSAVPEDRVADLAAAALREARLFRAALVLGPADRVGHDLHRLARRAWPTLLHGKGGWDAAWSGVAPLVVELPASGTDERLDVWRRTLIAHDAAELDGADLAAAVGHLRIGAVQISRAVESAQVHASAVERDVIAVDLDRGAKAQSALALERLSRRVSPTATWADLVLPAPALEQVQELSMRARHRDLVQMTWGVGGQTSKRRGLVALFAGPPGTGKTLAAEVVGAELGLDLYVIDLATVVDKYIGETEKNLERIFTAAEGVNAILVFDEADALFGRRSEVKDARDRYANVEVAYLLQRLEDFDGIGILTSNLKANLDESFSRRLDVVVDFPLPDEAARRVLWDACLGPHVPRADDVDLDFCARAFDLAGGDIRNIAVTAAFAAASSGRPLGMGELMQATHREYRKLGRLSLATEFGDYLPIATGATESA